jgi:hypothetical protein
MGHVNACEHPGGGDFTLALYTAYGGRFVELPMRGTPPQVVLWHGRAYVRVLRAGSIVQYAEATMLDLTPSAAPGTRPGLGPPSAGPAGTPAGSG